MNQLGELKQVDLREIWPSEPDDFTPWLGDEQNIKILGDTIGIELEVERLEKGVGPYRADVFCKDTASGENVLIENQIEKTDHSHLGQILTYAAGLSAVTIVWIARNFTDEHRAALDWLNEMTTEGIDFFGLEIELWRIGNSPPAPKFNVVSRPNEWTKAGGKAKGRSNLTQAKQLQLNYWTEFQAFLEKSKTKLTCRKPKAQHYIDFSIGTSKAHCCVVVNTVSCRIVVKLHIKKGDDRLPIFHHLEASKDAIESEMGQAIIWVENPNLKSSYLNIETKDFDPYAQETWDTQFKWLQDKLERFREHIAPRIKKFLAP